LCQYKGKNINLPGKSVTIVDGAGNTIFNSAAVAPSTTHRVTVPIDNTPFAWKIWKDPLNSTETSQYHSISANYPYEQSLVTRGLTQYMWYEHNVTLAQQATTLQIRAASANGFVLFVNGKKLGEVNEVTHGQKDVTVTITASVPAGRQTLSILSESYGFDNGMSAGSTRKYKGIIGPVILGSTNITTGMWNMRPYLVGETLQVFTKTGASKVPWISDWKSGGAVTWYQAEFIKPTLAEGEQLLLDVTGMQRGKLYLNGNNLGRYWLLEMNDGSGKPTQHLYHLSRDFLVDGSNLLTLAEITGATDPSQVHLVKRYIANGPGSLTDGPIDTCPL